LIKNENSTNEYVLLNNQSLISFEELDKNTLRKEVTNLEKGNLQFGIRHGMEVEILVSYVVN
jgi:hypothetical protein